MDAGLGRVGDFISKRISNYKKPSSRVKYKNDKYFSLTNKWILGNKHHRAKDSIARQVLEIKYL